LEFVGLYTVTPANAPYNGPEIQKAVTAGCEQPVDSFVDVPAGQRRSDLRISEVGPDSANLWAGRPDIRVLRVGGDAVVRVDQGRRDPRAAALKR
jgi:hypothetical protein